MIGAADPFEFVYTNTNTNLAPVVEFEPLVTVQSDVLPVELTCIVTDPDNDEVTVTLWYEINGISQTENFINTEGSLFSLVWDFEYNNSGENEINYRIEALDSNNSLTSTPTYSLNFVVPNENNDVQSTTGLISAYPNPFRDSLSISFKSNSNNQSVKVYNLKGQLVKEIKTYAKAGKTANVSWNGKDNSGRRVSSGIYYLVLQSNDSKDVRKVLMMK